MYFETNYKFYHSLIICEIFLFVKNINHLLTMQYIKELFIIQYPFFANQNR